MARNKNRLKETAVADDVKKDDQLNETPTDVQEPVGEQNPAEEQSGDGTDANEGAESEGEEPASDDQQDLPDDVAAAADDVILEEPALPEATAEATTELSDLAITLKEPLIPPVKSDRVEALISYIGEYVEKMNPSRFMDVKTGVPQQARLYRLLSDLIRLDFVEFKECMDRLLGLVHTHRAGAFNDLYSRRFFEQLYPTLTPPQVREFDNLLSIIVTIGAAANRSKAMAHVDLSFALKSVTDPKAQQNLAAYFSAMR